MKKRSLVLLVLLVLVSLFAFSSISDAIVFSNETTKRVLVVLRDPDGEDFEYFVLKPGSKSFKLFSIYYTFDIATDFTLPTYSSDGTYKTLVGRMVLGKNAVVKMEGITATTQDGGMTVNNASLEHLSVGKKTTISMVIERGEFVLYIDPR